MGAHSWPGGGETGPRVPVGSWWVCIPPAGTRVCRVSGGAVRVLPVCLWVPCVWSLSTGAVRGPGPFVSVACAPCLSVRGTRVLPGLSVPHACSMPSRRCHACAPALSIGGDRHVLPVCPWVPCVCSVPTRQRPVCAPGLSAGATRVLPVSASMTRTCSWSVRRCLACSPHLPGGATRVLHAHLAGPRAHSVPAGGTAAVRTEGLPALSAAVGPA